MGLFDEVFGTIGAIVGTVTGSIIGLSAVVIAEALGMTVIMVQEALNAGCTTYESIREFHKDSI